jgi:hypothetical protein
MSAYRPNRRGSGWHSALGAQAAGRGGNLSARWPNIGCPIWETPITPDQIAIADTQLSFVGPPIFLNHLP